MTTVNHQDIRDSLLYSTLAVDSKSIVISSLREWFARDPVFSYRADEFGFPLLPEDPLVGGGQAGMQGVIWGETSTRIVITDDYRYTSRFFPAITVSDNAGSNYEISFNQELSGIKYKVEEIVRNGKVITRRVPSHVIFAGAWKQSYGVNIITEDHATRKRLKDMVAILFNNVLKADLINKGILVERVALGGDREEQFANSYYYYSNINLELFSEWRREIPITELVEAIAVNVNVISAALAPSDVEILRDCVKHLPRYAAFYAETQSDGAEGPGAVTTKHEHNTLSVSWNKGYYCEDK